MKAQIKNIGIQLPNLKGICHEGGSQIFATTVINVNYRVAAFAHYVQ
jgi:hypothetical protein